MDELLEMEDCTPFVRGMVRLIKEGMLEVDPKKRLKIDRICAEIQQLKQLVAEDDDGKCSPKLVYRLSVQAETSDVSK
jgi:hypothetical protein